MTKVISQQLPYLRTCNTSEMSASSVIQCQSDSQQATLTERNSKNSEELNGLTDDDDDDDGEFPPYPTTAISDIKAELRSIACLMDDLLHRQTELNSLLLRLEPVENPNPQEKTTICAPSMKHTAKGQVKGKRNIFLPLFDPSAKDDGALKLFNRYDPLAGHDFEESLEMAETPASEIQHPTEQAIPAVPDDEPHSAPAPNSGSAAVTGPPLRTTSAAPSAPVPSAEPPVTSESTATSERSSPDPSATRSWDH
ncbi:unnamed protein product [Merluccius merluccius]